MTGCEGLPELLARVHPGFTSFGAGRDEVPCIVVGRGLFGRIMRAAAGRPSAVDAGLNILEDGAGHVFVDVSLDFGGGMREAFLADASESARFFELLAERSVLALSPPDPAESGSVFMIQLPKPDRAREALAMIRRGLSAGGGA